MKLRIAIGLIAALFSITPSHAVDELKDCDFCPEMVVVPAGEFMMGSPDKESALPDEKPLHLVKIAKPFAVGKFEVTFDQWDACVADSACKDVDDETWGRGNRPVINVDYATAKAYATWLSKKTAKPYRLLSESEWEYAARGGTVTAWYWGDIKDGFGLRAGCLNANVHDQTSRTKRPDFVWLEHPCEDGFVYTAPVGTFKANAFGLHDMLGNVAEWVDDCNIPYKAAPTDGSAAMVSDCEKRVTRGGSWWHGPTWVRAAFRHPWPASYASYTVGFRVARDLP